MKRMKWAWVAMVAWAAAAGAWAQPYMVPVGTNAGWTVWWVGKPGTNELDNWEGWYTQNTNWVWMSNQWFLVRGDLTTVSNSLQSHIAEGGSGISMDDVRNQGMVTNNHSVPVTLHSVSTTTGGFTNNGGAWTYGDGIHNIGGVQIDDTAGGELIIPNGNLVVRGSGLIYGNASLTNAYLTRVHGLKVIADTNLADSATIMIQQVAQNAADALGVNVSNQFKIAITNNNTRPVTLHSVSTTTGGFTNNGGAWTYGDGIHNIGGVTIDDTAGGELAIPGGDVIVKGAGKFRGNAELTNVFVSSGAYIPSTNAAYVGTDSDGKLVPKSAPASATVWEFNVSRTINGATPTPLWTNAWASGPDYRKMVNYRIIGKAATSGSLYIRDEPVVHHAAYGVLHDTYADVEQDLGSGGMQVTVTSNSVGLVWTVTGLAGENVTWRLVGTSDGYWASQ